MESRGARIARTMPIWGPILVGALVIAGLVATSMLKDHVRRQLAFTGHVSSIDVVFRGRRAGSKVDVEFALDNGDYVTVSMADSEAGYFQYEDYVVKIAGEHKFAVFREGRQVKAAGMFLERPINIDDYRPKKAVAESAPAPAPEPTPAGPPPTERIDALVAEASVLWRGGDGAKALERARQAHALCIEHLGESHAKTQQVRAMVDMASKAVKAP